MHTIDYFLLVGAPSVDNALRWFEAKSCRDVHFSYLSGKVGAAMIRGIQQLDSDGKFALLLGALKHVTAYSLENWQDDTSGPNHGRKYSRFGFNANISRRDLAETYLEQYRIAISEGKPLGMMCS